MPSFQTVVEGNGIGIIIGCSVNTFQVRVFYRMTSECLQRFSLPPITTTGYPLASTSNMMELVLQDEMVSVERSNVVNIAFVLPLFEECFHNFRAIDIIAIFLTLANWCCFCLVILCE